LLIIRAAGFNKHDFQENTPYVNEFKISNFGSVLPMLEQNCISHTKFQATTAKEFVSNQ
jgi:hypothetical protein